VPSVDLHGTSLSRPANRNLAAFSSGEPGAGGYRHRCPRCATSTTCIGCAPTRPPSNRHTCTAPGVRTLRQLRRRRHRGTSRTALTLRHSCAEPVFSVSHTGHQADRSRFASFRRDRALPGSGPQNRTCPSRPALRARRRPTAAASAPMRPAAAASGGWAWTSRRRQGVTHVITIFFDVFQSNEPAGSLGSCPLPSRPRLNGPLTRPHRTRFRRCPRRHPRCVRRTPQGTLAASRRPEPDYERRSAWSWSFLRPRWRHRSAATDGSEVAAGGAWGRLRSRASCWEPPSETKHIFRLGQFDADRVSDRPAPDTRTAECVHLGPAGCRPIMRLTHDELGGSSIAEARSPPKTADLACGCSPPSVPDLPAAIITAPDARPSACAATVRAGTTWVGSRRRRRRVELGRVSRRPLPLRPGVPGHSEQLCRKHSVRRIRDARTGRRV